MAKKRSLPTSSFDHDIDDDIALEAIQSLSEDDAEDPRKSVSTSKTTSDACKPSSSKLRKNFHRNQVLKARRDLSFAHDPQPPAASLSSVLRQALISKDKQLFDSVISSTDLGVIRETVAHLAVEHIDQFLSELTARLRQSPLRLVDIGPWIRQILRSHLVFCSSIPSIRSTLVILNDHIQAHMRHHKVLVTWQGHVDALVAICTQNMLSYDEQVRNCSNAAPVDMVPLMYFQEEDKKSSTRCVDDSKETGEGSETEDGTDVTESTFDPNEDDDEESIHHP